MTAEQRPKESPARAAGTEYPGRGDPRRTLELLWRKTAAPSRGPKPALSVDEIVAAAISVADRDGLVGLTMRRVADELGKSAMSLYTYVPGKAELIDLMVDTVIGELPTSYPTDKGWRAALEQSARDGWEHHRRHPWTLQIAGARAALGPNEFAWYEAMLAIVDGIGLSGLDMSRVVNVVAGYVRGAAKAVADAVEAERVTGITDDEWWTARLPVLEQLVAEHPGSTPVADRLAAEGVFEQRQRQPDDTTPYMAYEAIDTFEFGLQRLLDGIAAHIDRVR